MKKSPLINLKQTATKLSLNLPKRSHPEANSGFTLIELLVVVIIIGVLSTIAAPSWLAFVNRQRVNKVNDAILSSLQDAQREARRTKSNYSVSFRTKDDVSEVATYRNPPDANLNANQVIWKSLTAELGVNPNQVVLFSNLDGVNQTAPLNIAPAAMKTITFNYLGALDLQDNADLGTHGLVVGVGVPDGNDGVIAATKRCVKVRTLIGGIQTGSGEGDAECPEA
ncbi:MAG: type II secretion system protein [Symploca sp. SIO3E6]|nr:type II secretion system protein [Caldora sp. SIO3E6]